MFYVLPAGMKTSDDLKSRVKQCLKERDIDLYGQEAQELTYHILRGSVCKEL
jgi:hypothetical protein